MPLPDWPNPLAIIFSRPYCGILESGWLANDWDKSGGVFRFGASLHETTDGIDADNSAAAKSPPLI